MTILYNYSCFPLHLLSEIQCQCTAEYNIYSMRNGTKVKNQAYCNQWDTDDYPEYFFCYLSGGLAAATCPGATKYRNVYYTSDPSVCIEAETEGAISGEYRNKCLVYASYMQSFLSNIP